MRAGEGKHHTILRRPTGEKGPIAVQDQCADRRFAGYLSRKLGGAAGILVRYEVEFLPDARHDLKRLSPEISRRIMRKIIAMQDDLAGNVRRLVHYTPGFRLRVGDWRVLFEVAASMIIIHRIVHRSEAYE